MFGFLFIFTRFLEKVVVINGKYVLVLLYR